ncbi:MAG: hypothetical protein QOG07_3390 [Pseudonocardiales bacterium]|jgi:hypothetical protein|nr:hypothetical protein [Pseudonocardiales bacterium]MDT4981511.1 hypothetical protein [Pseudonocardiales bacterium]
MRRSVYVLAAACTAMLLVAPLASAIGPGGWDRVGVGVPPATSSLNGAVYALNTQNPGVLYAGGNFTSAGGNTNAAHIARWSGTSWSALGTTPLTGDVHAIAYAAGRVYAGGTFLNAGANANADFLAVWDGSAWAPFCNSTVPGPAFTGNVNALQIIGNTLYVGGSFQNGAGLVTADYLVGCDLTSGAASSTVLTDGDFSGSVYALTADSNGTLYAGGGFINVAAIPEADHVAAYDGSWHAMGGGPAVDSFVRSLTASATNVYVGTDSVDVAGIANADHVARWNGTAWSAVGSNSAGTNGWFSTTTTIDALATYGSIVIAAGSFQNANGNAAADGIAYFDGTNWRPIGSNGAGNGPLPAHVVALGLTGGKLYAGGNFTTAGGDSLGRFLAAYALRLPDASIAAGTASPYVGNNVYSATGAGEGRSVTVTRGHSVSSYIRVQNDGLVAASITVKGTGGATGIAAHYYRNGASLTTAVRAGTYVTPILAPQAYVVIQLVVTVARPSAATATITTTIRSQIGIAPDAVRVVVKATG